MVAVIPMAGRGSRFSTAGYQTPKPLIEVAGKPMVLWALESLKDLSITKIIFILLQEHEDQFRVRDLLRDKIAAPTEFVFLKEVTEGQLSTVLAARHLLDENEDVLVASSDTLVEGELNRDIGDKKWSGIISVANLPGEQWSFAKTNDIGEVTEVAEKKRISDHASTGLYYFRRAGDLMRFGDGMIAREERTRGEYYIIPVYQKFIDAGLKVGISKAKAMWDMGNPEAKALFEKNYPGLNKKAF